MKKPLILALTLLSTSLQAQTYTQLQWGVNKATTPYQFGANINGTWSNLGTVSSAGVWQIPASNISGVATLAGNNTWTGLNTFNGGLKQTVAPIVYNWAAVPTYLAFFQELDAAKANDPEIGTVMLMRSNTGASDAVRNFKMPLGVLAVANPGSSAIWGENIVTQLQPGVGANTGQIGLEIDTINLARDFTGALTWPYSVGLYITSAADPVGNIYKINNAGVAVDGSDLTWDYGFVTHTAIPTSTINTAAFADLSKAPTAFYSAGDNNIGMNLTGTYTTYSLAAPSFTVDPIGNINSRAVNVNSAASGYYIATNQTLFDNGSFVVLNSHNAATQALLLSGVNNFYTANSHYFRNNATSTTYLSLLSTGATLTYGAGNALTVGPNGTTNPAFNVNSSAASSATGLNIVSRAATSGVDIFTTSSGANENLNINSLGSGSLTLNGSATGNIVLGSTTYPKTTTAGTILTSATANTVTASATPTLGVAGSTVGSIAFANATSGSITLAPTTGALGTVTASLPANTGTIAELNLAQTWSAIQTFDAAIKLKAYIVSGLPTCNAGAEGNMAYVTDATVPTYNAALTGGGAVKVPVFCNGSAWTSH